MDGWVEAGRPALFLPRPHRGVLVVQKPQRARPQRREHLHDVVRQNVNRAPGVQKVGVHGKDGPLRLVPFHLGVFEDVAWKKRGGRKRKRERGRQSVKASKQAKHTLEQHTQPPPTLFHAAYVHRYPAPWLPGGHDPAQLVQQAVDAEEDVVVGFDVPIGADKGVHGAKVGEPEEETRVEPIHIKQSAPIRSFSLSLSLSLLRFQVEAEIVLGHVEPDKATKRLLLCLDRRLRRCRSVRGGAVDVPEDEAHRNVVLGLVAAKESKSGKSDSKGEERKRERKSRLDLLSQRVRRRRKPRLPQSRAAIGALGAGLDTGNHRKGTLSINPPIHPCHSRPCPYPIAAKMAFRSSPPRSPPSP